MDSILIKLFTGNISALCAFCFLLLAFLTANKSELNSSGPAALSLCDPAVRWTHDGRDMLRDYRAHLLLVAFPPLQNCSENCAEILDRYNEFLEYVHDIKLILVAPYTVAPPYLRSLSQRYSNLRFEHDTNEAPIRRLFGAQDYDNFIFDRCGRLSGKILFRAKIIKEYDNSITGGQRGLMFDNNELSVHFRDTLDAIKTAVTFARCGWCQFDTVTERSTAEQNMISEKQRRYFNSSSLQYTQLKDGRKILGSDPIPQVHPVRIVFNMPSSNVTNSSGSNYDRNRNRIKNLYSTQPAQSYQRAIRPQAQVSIQVSTQLSPNHAKVQQTGSRAQPQTHNHIQAWPQAQTQVSTQHQKAIQTKLPKRYLQQYGPSNGDSTTIVPYYQSRTQNTIAQRQQNDEHARRDKEYRKRHDEYFQHLQKYQQQQQQQQQGHRQSPRENQDKNSQQNIPLETEISSRRNSKPASSPIQYSKDAYSDRYQYRLHSGSFRDAAAHRDTEKRREAAARAQLDAQRQAQVAEIHRQRAVQQELQKKQEQVRQLQQMEQQRLKMEESAVKWRPENSNPKVDPAPLYPEGSENFQYYDDDDEWTTAAPKASDSLASTVSIWPTPMESRDYGFNLPCDSFTDEICYQQQAQLKPPAMQHRCCKNRILFTDQCQPKRCSNITQQLCCIQKFLQAKLNCCQDDKQLDVDLPGDQFSRCCHRHFITDDDSCCTSTYAKAQWRTAHELCLPNVDVDLSQVRVPSLLAGTSLTTEFDFGKASEKWNFTCKYGAHVPQFSYLSDEK